MGGQTPDGPEVTPVEPEAFPVKEFDAKEIPVDAAMIRKRALTLTRWRNALAPVLAESAHAAKTYRRAGADPSAHVVPEGLATPPPVLAIENAPPKGIGAFQAPGRRASGRKNPSTTFPEERRGSPLSGRRHRGGPRPFPNCRQRLPL